MLAKFRIRKLVAICAITEMLLFMGGNPARPEGALEWSARAAERQGGNRGTAFASASRDRRRGEPRSQDPRPGTARRGPRRGSPCTRCPGRDSSWRLEGTSLSTLWPLLRAYLDEWLLQPADGPRVHLMLDEPLGNLAADGTCGSLAGDDTLRIVEDDILAARVPAGRFSVGRA